MKVAVVIPCYNEEITIKSVIEDYKKYFTDIYVIDNNCTDATAAIAKESGVIVLESNIQGKGEAIKTAFDVIDADLIILTDGDSTYLAKDSYNLLVYWLSNQYLEMVVGNRLSSKYFSKQQIINGIGNRLFSKITELKYKTTILDLLSGSRLITKGFYKNMKITHSGFEIETELTVSGIKKNNNIAYIDIDYIARPKNSKSSINIIKDGFAILKYILLEKR